MPDDKITTFTSLLDKELKLIDKFQEHLNFAASLVEDEKIKAFFAHLIDEENEHKEELEALKAQVGEVASAPPAVSAKSTAGDDNYGHFQRRDQNILTVGSLYGVRQ